MDPLDELMHARGLDPDVAVEDAEERRLERGDNNAVNRLRDRTEKRRVETERITRNIQRLS